MSPMRMSPSWKVSGSRSASSWVTIWTSLTKRDDALLFSKLTLYGSGWPSGSQPPVSIVCGPVIDASRPSLAEPCRYLPKLSVAKGSPPTSSGPSIWNCGGMPAPRSSNGIHGT